MEGLHESIAWAYDRPPEDRRESRFSELATDDITFWVRGEPDVVPFVGTFRGRGEVANFERRFSESVEGLKRTPRYTVSQKDGDGIVVMVFAQVAGTAKPTGRSFLHEAVHEWRLDGAGRLRGFIDWNHSFDFFQAFAPEPVDPSLVFRHPLPDDVITPTRPCAVDPTLAVDEFYAALIDLELPRLVPLFDDNIVSQLEGVEGIVPFSGTYRGRQEATRQLELTKKSIEVIVSDVNTRYVVEGNRVCARFSEAGTLAIPTGKPIYFVNLHCFTVTDEGKIRQFRSYNHTHVVWRAFTKDG
jgi:ketosteroid isomerase-like protein